MKNKNIIYGIIAVVVFLVLAGYLKIPGFQAAYVTEKCYDITYDANNEEVWTEVPCPEAAAPPTPAAPAVTPTPSAPAVATPAQPAEEEEKGIFDVLLAGKNFWIILIIIVFIVYYFGFEMGPKKGLIKSKR